MSKADAKLLKGASPERKEELLNFARAVTAGISTTAIVDGINELLNAKTILKVKKAEGDGEKTDSTGRKNDRAGDYEILEDMPDLARRTEGQKLAKDWYLIARDNDVGRPIERIETKDTTPVSNEDKMARLMASPTGLMMLFMKAIGPEGAELKAQMLKNLADDLDSSEEGKQHMQKVLEA